MYYVYDLIDPRDSKTFYAGKGTDNRCHEHVKDAKKGIRGRKCDLIREILAADQEVQVKIVKEFESEVMAYAFEKRRIAKIGLANLTNIAPGGGGVRALAVDERKVSREEVISLLTRVVAKPEPKHGLWAAALHRAAVRALPRLIENRA